MGEYKNSSGTIRAVVERSQSASYETMFEEGTVVNR